MCFAWLTPSRRFLLELVFPGEHRVPAFADAQCGANASHAPMFRKKGGRIRGNFEQFS
jgi:hypothetical protein